MLRLYREEIANMRGLSMSHLQSLSGLESIPHELQTTLS